MFICGVVAGLTSICVSNSQRDILLQSHAAELGVGDVQLRLTPLEEVFLNVTRKAELQHAEAEGRFETLHLLEENVIIKVPVGAEFIQSPGKSSKFPFTLPLLEFF